MRSAHPLILVLAGSNLLTIKPDEEKQNNWTKLSHDTAASRFHLEAELLSTDHSSTTTFPFGWPS